MKSIVLLLALSIAVPAGATGDKHPKPPAKPPTVVVDRGDDHGELKGAIVGALITWAILRHRNKRRAPAVPSCPVTTCGAPPAATCPGPSERENRIFEACVQKGERSLQTQ